MLSRLTAALVLLALVAPAAAAIVAYPPSTPACGPRLVHPPILVVGDFGPLGLALGVAPDGTIIPRPGSGVTGGAGTPEDPFRIAGWCIAGPAMGDGKAKQAGVAINISNVRSHLVIEENLLADFPWYAIHLQDVGPVSVVDNLFRSDSYGVFAERTESVRIERNVVEANARTAFNLVDSTGAVIRDNTVDARGARWSIGVHLWRSAGTLVESNRLTSNTGVLLVDSEGTHVSSNLVLSSANGIMVESGRDSVVAENTIRWNLNAAVKVLGPAVSTAIVRNVIDMSGRGIDIGEYARRTLVAENVIGSTGSYGIEARGRETVIRANDVDASRTHGILARGVVTLDANTVRDAGAEGIILVNAYASTVRDNVVSSSMGAGMRFEQTVTTKVTGNRIEGNGQGIVVALYAQGLAFTGNDLSGNGIGLDARAASTLVDARSNWWGCSEGPAHPTCDSAAGAVTVDPWSSEPST